MRALIQRVSQANLAVENSDKKESIQRGLVVLVGISRDDNENDIDWITEKTINLRIFPDQNNKMNFSLMDISGDMLIVSQFTLYGDCRKGRRPDFTQSAPPESAEILYNKFLDRLKNKAPQLDVKSGVFGAVMKIEILNDGPVTIMLDSKVTK